MKRKTQNHRVEGLTLTGQSGNSNIYCSSNIETCNQQNTTNERGRSQVISNFNVPYCYAKLSLCCVTLLTWASRVNKESRQFSHIYICLNKAKIDKVYLENVCKIYSEYKNPLFTIQTLSGQARRLNRFESQDNPAERERGLLSLQFVVGS